MNVKVYSKQTVKETHPMNVKVYSQQTVKKTHPQEVLISIRNPASPFMASYPDLVTRIEDEGFASVLVLEFDDILQSEDGTLFERWQADQILDFVKGQEHIAIHCAAGMSRSVAVGAFLRDYFNANVEFTVTGHDNFRNIHVYNILRRQFLGITL